MLCHLSQYWSRSQETLENQKLQNVEVLDINPKELAQVAKALKLVAFPSGLKFEFFWVQTILYGHANGEAEFYLIRGRCLAQVRNLLLRSGYTYLGGFRHKKNKKIS